jgi:hypothetical protein
MIYAMKPLACDPQKIKGLPEKLIVSHYSYHMEYGAKAAAYVDAFMENIHYGNAGIRLENATRVHA